MALKTMIENITRARKEYEDQLAAVGDDAQQGVAEMLAEAIPPGFFIRWRQYTPYFNDGEPCTFSVYSPYLIPAGKPPAEDGEDDDDDDDDDGGDDEARGFDLDNAAHYGDPKRTWSKTFDGVTKEQVEALAAVWSTLPEDMLEKVFGDHSTVTVRHDGTFERDDYEHD